MADSDANRMKVLIVQLPTPSQYKDLLSLSPLHERNYLQSLTAKFLHRMESCDRQATPIIAGFTQQCSVAVYRQVTLAHAVNEVQNWVGVSGKY